jgi:hypothetical protein
LLPLRGVYVAVYKVYGLRPVYCRFAAGLWSLLPLARRLWRFMLLSIEKSDNRKIDLIE